DQIEGIENFSISLFRAEGAQLGEPRTAIVTIVDDESGRDLIGNWRLDESSISDGVIDSSDNANTGTFRNFDPNDIVSGPRPDAPSVASGNGGAIFFDGQNDYIQIGPDAALDVSEGTFSQSVWIKPTDNNNGTYQGVLGYQDGGTSTRYPGIWVYQQDRIHTGFGDGSNWNSFNSGSVLTVDQWNHVATTFDGTEYIIYVNGAQVASTDQYAGRTPANTNQLNIGRVDNYFEGGIDDVRIYNRALSAQEINVLIDGADLPTIPVDGNFVTETLYSGFDTPLAVDWLPDGKLVVLEQAGRLQVINPDGTRQATPLLDISDRVNAGTKDRGALGFAVHPDFENNPYVYVSYTYDPPEVYQGSGLGGPDGNGARVARIARYTVNALGTFADPDSEFVLVGNNSTFDNIGNPNIRPGLNDPHSCIDGSGNPIEDCIPADETSHTIGDLDFGTDGYLYASSGDGGSFGRVDPINLRALDIDSLAGKILRIDPITGEGPADNPFYNGDPNANQSKVYQYGLRNPFRLAVNPGDGEVFVGDVGWTTWEEINTGRGANFGWPAFEGGNGTSLETRRYRDLAEVQSFYASNPDVTAPIYARNHSDGSRAIVMGDFINSSVYPEQFQGDLVFTDIGDQVLRTLDFDAAGGVTSVDIVSDPVGFLVDFQMHSDGYLYYVDITGSVGRLQYQIG
ncbi:MAG: PQQ-dependent sugar dehydrogenase, partial [Planctomycetota bacterium]